MLTYNIPLQEPLMKTAYKVLNLLAIAVVISLFVVLFATNPSMFRGDIISDTQQQKVIEWVQQNFESAANTVNVQPTEFTVGNIPSATPVTIGSINQTPKAIYQSAYVLSFQQGSNKYEWRPVTLQGTLKNGWLINSAQYTFQLSPTSSIDPKVFSPEPNTFFGLFTYICSYQNNSWQCPTRWSYTPFNINFNTSQPTQNTSSTNQSANQNTVAPQNTNSNQQSSSQNQQPIAREEEAVLPERKFQDGTFRAEGDYQSPGGLDIIELVLDVKDDIVQSLAINIVEADPTSEFMIGKFQDGIDEFIVGKNLDGLTSPEKVNGSSLTSEGFNIALAKIQQEAAN